MAKFLCITLNPAIDFTVGLDTLNVGSVNRQQFAQSHTAGKGLNVAQVLRDLGHDVMVSGFLGRANAAVFQAHFAEQDFADHFVYVDGETRQNIKIAESCGRMTDINGKGFSVSETDKAELLKKAAALAAEADFTVMSGSLPQQFGADDFQTLSGRLKTANPRLAVDTSGEALKAALACKPFLIKPNTDELRESFGLPAGTAAQQAALLAEFGGGIEHAVVSMGADGVNWLHGGLCLHASAAKVEVKSTVGAGDTLTAGMLHGLASGFTPEETLRTAAALAANAVAQIGFRIPNPQRLNELKQSITIQTERFVP